MTEARLALESVDLEGPREDLKTKVQHRPKGAGGNQEFQFVRPTLSIHFLLHPLLHLQTGPQSQGVIEN